MAFDQGADRNMTGVHWNPDEFFAFVYAYQGLPNETFPNTAIVSLITLTPNGGNEHVSLPIAILDGNRFLQTIGKLDDPKSPFWYYRAPEIMAFTENLSQAIGRHNAVLLSATKILKLANKDLKPTSAQYQKRIRFEVSIDGIISSKTNKNRVQFSFGVIAPVSEFKLSPVGLGNPMLKYKNPKKDYFSGKSTGLNPDPLHKNDEWRPRVTGWFDFKDPKEPVVVFDEGEGEVDDGGGPGSS